MRMSENQPETTEEVVEAPVAAGGRTRAALEREKTLVLRSIKELEFDHAMKKVAQRDFDEMSARLRARAMRLMKQLDQAGYRQTIEQELARRVVDLEDVTASSESAPAAAAPAHASPGTLSSAAAVTCACGTVNDADARFCKNCGNRLAAA